jgi:hypothetical protein
MEIGDLLKGKIVKFMTDAKVEVELEIEYAKETTHSRDLEPSTKENDWWPASENWTTIDVTFTNGFKKSFANLSEIKIA